MKLLCLPKDLDKISQGSVIWLGGEQALKILEDFTRRKEGVDGDKLTNYIWLPFYDDHNAFAVMRGPYLERSFHVVEIEIEDLLDGTNRQDT